MYVYMFFLLYLVSTQSLSPILPHCWKKLFIIITLDTRRYPSPPLLLTRRQMRVNMLYFSMMTFVFE